MAVFPNLWHTMGDCRSREHDGVLVGMHHSHILADVVCSHVVKLVDGMVELEYMVVPVL